MAKRTPLYARHAALGAKLVDFGGWDMPLHYGSQLDEHHRVRRVAGVFDVSHMTVVDFADPDPTRALAGRRTATCPPRSDARKSHARQDAARAAH